MISGGASLGSIRGAGREPAPIATLDGVSVTREPHAARESASEIAPTRSSTPEVVRTLSTRHLLSPEGALPYRRVSPQIMQNAAPRSLALDYAVGICGVWISGGFFLDAWAHGHVPVENFFTPYHAVFYSGMVALGIFLVAFALRSRRQGYAWRDVFPQPYHLALVGIPIFAAAGIGDMLWHRFFGIEEGVDALLSPTHQVLGLGIFFVAAGPIRSVLAQRGAVTAATQLPLALGLATWLILTHFGTAYAFDPAAGRTNAPPPIVPFTPDYLTALAIGYYKIATGVLIVIFQCTLIAGFALWLVSRMRPSPGMFTTLLVLGNVPAAAAFTNQTPLLAVTVAQALITGIFADYFATRYDPSPSPERAAVFRTFAVAVPMVYAGIYFAGTAIADGIWWDWNIVLGCWIWSGVCGFALTLPILARRTP